MHRALALSMGLLASACLGSDPFVSSGTDPGPATTADRGTGSGTTDSGAFVPADSGSSGDSGGSSCMPPFCVPDVLGSLDDVLAWDVPTSMEGLVGTPIDERGSTHNPEEACETGLCCRDGIQCATEFPHMTAVQCVAPGKLPSCYDCQPFSYCETDAECAPGDVCDYSRDPCHCDEGALVCQPPCRTHEECSDFVPFCEAGVCMNTNCAAVGVDCPPHFECSDNACNRRQCVDDSDCAADGGVCVNDECYPRMGDCRE